VFSDNFDILINRIIYIFSWFILIYKKTWSMEAKFYRDKFPSLQTNLIIRQWYQDRLVLRIGHDSTNVFGARFFSLTNNQYY